MASLTTIKEAIKMTKLHKWKGLNFFRRPKVAHIEPYLWKYNLSKSVRCTSSIIFILQADNMPHFVCMLLWFRYNNVIFVFLMTIIVRWWGNKGKLIERETIWGLWAFKPFLRWPSLLRRERDHQTPELQWKELQWILPTKGKGSRNP